ncbi:MAG: DegT/DnrJ/EryC1/StrS family aminotransferase [Bryobacteraceae bacterium]|nr:DegT/DnrJ/EryC1/StrS family aminotransferase [Bryobacteraceae bacterium]
MSTVSRREFVAAASAGSFGLAKASNGKLALMGGEPVRKAQFPSWPKFGKPEEQGIREVLQSGRWFRGYGKHVERFEQAYAQLTGARHCIATASGTAALFTALNGMGVGPGDEVLVPPYTFVATINVVLLQHALPVFIDTDIETFQMDATKTEAAITERTTAIMPVHLGGGTVDMDAFLKIGARRKVGVLEDACQAHLAEWRGKKAGTLGAAGCFSFQASKNLNSGEGGAILINDDDLADRCYAFHSNGRSRKGDASGFSYLAHGSNERLTEFQGALLLAQMTRLEEQSKAREQNAAYLTGLLKEIPGIQVAKMYSGCTRNAYHLYMFRYNKEAFAGAPRAEFLKAMSAEGIPCSAGYSPLNKEPFLAAAINSKGYRRLFPEKTLKHWQEKNQCPANDQLCEEAVWLTQNMLLGPRGDMDEIAAAIRKVQAGAPELKRA